MLLRFYLLIFVIFNVTFAIPSYIPFSSDINVNVFVYTNIPSVGGAILGSSLTIGSRISHCNIGTNSEIVPNIDRKLTFRLGIGFIGKERKVLILTRCLSQNNMWIYESSYFNCYEFDSPTDLVQVLDLDDDEIFVIICKYHYNDYIKEIFIEEYPKIQVVQLYSNTQRDVSILPDMYISYGVKIPCVSNFPYLTKILWKRTKIVSQRDYSKGQFLIIDFDLNSSFVGVEETVNEYECSLSYTVFGKNVAISSKFKFFVQINYAVKILDRFENSSRKDFDVGETIRCSANHKAKFAKNVVWYDPVVMVGLTKDITKTSFIQKPEEILTIRSVENAPASLYVICFIEGSASQKYKIFNKKITIFTSDITNYIWNNGSEPLDKFKDMKCEKDTEKIYLFSNPTIKLPLSKMFDISKSIGTKDNLTVSLPSNFSNNERYFVVCVSPNYIKTPVELKIGNSTLVKIIPIFPYFIIPSIKQTKGFVYECLTDERDYYVKWQCPLCSPEQMQQTEFRSNRSQYLHITSNSDITITYLCVGFLQNNQIIKKELILNIYGNMIAKIQQPKYFYALGDPVICLATRRSSVALDELIIPLPSRYLAVSTQRHFDNSSEKDFDYINKARLSPRIPEYSMLDYKNYGWKFKGCCLTYNVKLGLECGVLEDLYVVVNYTFKYNYDIPTVVIYPGNIIKCCIIRRSSVDPVKFIWDGDNKHNCLAAIILFYANQDRSATPDNPGELLFEGTQIIVPTTYRGNDITKAATFVKCYINSLFQKEADLKRSAIQLQIKSCALSPPPLLMIPSDQTLFLVNNTIKCIPDSELCKDTLLFNFRIERGGILIEIINKTVSIVLTNKYLGKNIRVTCESETNKAFKDISVERVPYFINITGLAKIIVINSVIRCASDGFPEPHIVWTQINGTSVLHVDDDDIIIRNWDRSGPYEMTCTAFNKHGETSKNIKFEIFNINMRDTYFSKEFYIIIYFELFLYHCFLVLIAYFLFKEYLFNIKYSSSPKRHL